MNMKCNQGGLTLIEVAIVVAVLGIVSVGIAAALREVAGAESRYYNEKHRMNNERAVAALKSYASDQNFANKGVVPSPYTGGGYGATLYNPADVSEAGVALANALSDTGIAQREINDDGLTVPRIRAYQLLPNLINKTSLDGPGTDQVTLRYQFGAVYQTACVKGNLTCAPNPASGVPGSSGAITAATLSTWTTTGTDGPPATFSTLQLQKMMLGESVRRLRVIQDKFQWHFNALLIKSAAGDATNFYPAGTPLMAGVDPTSGVGQGCRDGWYPLNTGGILDQIGVSISEFGTTKWGGAVEFCRDYDPTGSKAPDATPHFAAIRINKDVSLGIAPDASVIGNNVILTL
jgi:prepilin-type N-terminal cleavage/methylation domain-containing protein